MTIEKLLYERSSQCELCQSYQKLQTYTVPDSPTSDVSAHALLCAKCRTDIEAPEHDVHHWRCLNDAIWHPEPVIQVLAWRMLQRIKDQGWPQDLIDMMYLEPEMAQWAAASGDGQETQPKLQHRDVNGVPLSAGDSVVLIKDLKVKGSNMVAKQGTAVRRISLDPENEAYIEGKVDGQTIVLVTQYVKKT